MIGNRFRTAAARSSPTAAAIVSIVSSPARDAARIACRSGPASAGIAPRSTSAGKHMAMTGPSGSGAGGATSPGSTDASASTLGRGSRTRANVRPATATSIVRASSARSASPSSGASSTRKGVPSAGEEARSFSVCDSCRRGVSPRYATPRSSLPRASAAPPRVSRRGAPSRKPCTSTRPMRSRSILTITARASSVSATRHAASSPFMFSPGSRNASTGSAFAGG